MIDFRKAFDLDDNTLLLEKRKCFKFSDIFVPVMESNQDGKSQIDFGKSKMSESGFIKCGVRESPRDLYYVFFYNLYLSIIWPCICQTGFIQQPFMQPLQLFMTSSGT